MAISDCRKLSVQCPKELLDELLKTLRERLTMAIIKATPEETEAFYGCGLVLSGQRCQNSLSNKSFTQNEGDPPLDLQNLPWDPAQMAGTASLSLSNHKKPVEKEEDEPEHARQQTLDQDEHDKQMQAKSEQEIDQLVENLTTLYRQKNSKCP